MHRRLAAPLFGIAIACGPSTLAHARQDIIGLEAFDANLDLRASAVDGERGWLEDGFGKLREGGAANRDTKVRLRAA